MSVKKPLKKTLNKTPINENTIFISSRRAIPATIGLVVFVIISYFVVTRDTLYFDTIIRHSIYGIRGESLTTLFTMITYMGNWLTILLICGLLLLNPRTFMSFGVPASAAAIFACLIQKALKVSFHRARPDLSLHLINQGGYSFPSGHSFSVLIFYGMIIFLCRRTMKNKKAANLTTIFLACLIPLIGFSRIYLGVHFPTDVLGGWSLGLSVLMVLESGVLFIQNDKRFIFRKK